MRKNQVLIQECRTVKQSDISIPTMKITIKPYFIIHNIAGEQVLIGMGEEVDFSKMLLLNDTAAYIITALQKKSATSEELVKQLIEEYNVSLQQARMDIERLLDELKQLEVVTISRV